MIGDLKEVKSLWDRGRSGEFVGIVGFSFSFSCLWGGVFQSVVGFLFVLVG